MTYIPNDKQVEAHCATEQFLGYGGAMGGGKTRWLCEMAKLLSIKFPNNLGLLARQSGPALRLSTQEVFFSEVLPQSRDKKSEWMQLGCKFNKAEGILEFRANGSKIWFTGLDSDNVERVKSLNLGFFGIDEATETAESMFMMLATRLRRAGIPKAFRKAMISANPEAGWVKRRFVDQNLPNHRFVEANYKDNPYLPDDYPSLFDTLPLTWRQKYLDGNWGAVSGLIYQDMEPDFHIIPYAPLPPEWRALRGLDHGQQNPTACLGMGVGYTDQLLEALIGDRMDGLDKKFDSYPVIVVQKMYYSPGLVSDHRREIAALWPHFRGPTYADPSMWKKDREKMLSDGKRVEYSIANEYGETPHPLTGLIRGNNIVNVGINRVAQLLRIGHLFFMDHPSMEELIGLTGELRSYSWKQPRTDDDDWPEVPDKKRDHGCDALRYACMSLPPLKSEGAKVIPYDSFAAAKLRAEAHKRGHRQLTIHGGRVVGI